MGPGAQTIHHRECLEVSRCNKLGDWPKAPCNNLLDLSKKKEKEEPKTKLNFGKVVRIKMTPLENYVVGVKV